MAKYNLSTGVEEGFEFTVVDPKSETPLTYKLRYPSASDFEPGKALDLEIDDLNSKKANPDTTLEAKREIQNKIEELEKRKAALFYDLITPVEHETNIEDVMQRVPIPVVRNFNNMVSGEFGA